MGLPAEITFDCHGTLVDFDLDTVTTRVLAERAAGIERDAFLRQFAAIRFQEILGEYRPFREVLRRGLATAMERSGLACRDEDGEAIGAAVPSFGSFPDVPPVLERLRHHCKLAIISNTDDDLTAGNVRTIGVPFERVVTAE